jgi:hypothetical protein
MVLATAVACLAAVLAWTVVLSPGPQPTPAPGPAASSPKPKEIPGPDRPGALSYEQLGVDQKALAEDEAQRQDGRRQPFQEAVLPGEASAQRALELVYNDDERAPKGASTGAPASVGQERYRKQAQRIQRKTVKGAGGEQRSTAAAGNQVAPPDLRPLPSDEVPDSAAPPPPAETATLLVSARPWGKVLLNGKLVGDTPQTLELPAGTPEVTVEYLGQTYRCPGKLAAGERARCDHEFDSQPP